MDEASGDEWSLGRLLPRSFDAYCGIRHPMRLRKRELSWQEAAVELGVSERDVKHTLFRQLLDHGATPRYGSPLPDQTRSLLATLQQFDQPQTSMFLIWEGYAVVYSNPSFFAEAETSDYFSADDVAFPITSSTGRRYFLCSGTFDDAQVLANVTGRTLPDFMWSQDLTWFIASDMDLATTYLGGSNEVVDALLTHDELETIRIQPDDSITLGLYLR